MREEAHLARRDRYRRSVSFISSARTKAGSDSERRRRNAARKAIGKDMAIARVRHLASVHADNRGVTQSICQLAPFLRGTFVKQFFWGTEADRFDPSIKSEVFDR